MGQLSSAIEEEARGLTHAEDTYRVYTTAHDVVEVPAPPEGFSWREELRELGPSVSAVRRRLLRTLLGRQQRRWLRDRSRGELDPRSLHRLAARSSPRVFRRPLPSDGGIAACTLLVDASASMRGEQMALARRLAAVFGHTLSVLGFPTEIIAFSTEDRDLRYEVARQTGESEEDLARRYSRMVPLYHGIFKRFEEPWEMAAGRLGALRSKSLTPLGESLLFAAGRLARRPERRKVLLCLTDGKPVTGAWDEQVTFSHACRSVKRISRAGVEPVRLMLMFWARLW